MLTLHKNTPLVTGGIIFLLIALLHLIRLVTHTQVLVGSREIPFNSSIIALIITVALGIWLLAAAKQK